MTIGVVSEIARTDKGAPYIVVNGNRLYASKCETPPTGLTVGMKIDYEANPFGDTGRDGKRPLGLKRWKAIVDASGQPETGSTVSDVDILRSVSNIVGNACAAGMVKEPAELEKWFVAAYWGFLHMQNVKDIAADQATGVDPEPNGDSPDRFYDNLPPQRQNGQW